LGNENRKNPALSAMIEETFVIVLRLKRFDLRVDKGVQLAQVIDQVRW
jgi:hypothetical protein